MTIPTHLPGVVSKPQVSLEQRVAELETRLSEFMRRDLSNAVVGEGGTFRATLEAGGVDVLRIGPGNPLYGAKQQLVLRDIAGKPTYALDELAGYGLSHPSLVMCMAGVESQGPALPTTAGSAALIAAGTTYVYNPVWHVMLRLRFANGATPATATAVFTIRRLDGTVVGTTSQNFVIPTNVFYTPTFERMILLAPVDIGTRLSGEVKLYAPTGVDLAVQAFPIMSVGISRAQYDLLPGLH